MGGLVLTRREGTRIRLMSGTVEIWINVVEARRGSARLSIEADPTEGSILREELIEPAVVPEEAQP